MLCGGVSRNNRLDKYALLSPSKKRRFAAVVAIIAKGVYLRAIMPFSVFEVIRKSPLASIFGTKYFGDL